MAAPLPASETDDDLTPDALDDGPNDKQGPHRRCLASGQSLPVNHLIRFVVDPDGTVVPDVAGKLPGRGMWLSADAQSIKTALQRRLFARAARRGVTVDPTLADRVEGLLARRCRDTISLARRAGEAVCGFEKTRAMLTSGKATVLVQARDGAVDGRKKLTALAGSNVPTVAVLDAAELGTAFGRDATVHAALSGTGLADRFVIDAGRLAGFRLMASDGMSDGKEVV